MNYSPSTTESDKNGNLYLLLFWLYKLSLLHRTIVVLGWVVHSHKLEQNIG